MRFFQLVRGDDAPQFSVVEYRGKRVAFSDVWKLKLDRDDDLVFEIAREVMFTHCPGLDYIFSASLGPAIDQLREFGRVVRLKAKVGCDMFAFFPRAMDLFDEAKMGLKFAYTSKGSVVGYQSIAFMETLRGTEIGCSQFRGVLGECFFSEEFVRGLSRATGVGCYLSLWEDGAAGPIYLRSDLTPLRAGDERQTMRAESRRRGEVLKGS